MLIQLPNTCDHQYQYYRFCWNQINPTSYTSIKPNNSCIITEWLAPFLAAIPSSYWINFYSDPSFDITLGFSHLPVIQDHWGRLHWQSIDYKPQKSHTISLQLPCSSGITSNTTLNNNMECIYIFSSINQPLCSYFPYRLMALHTGATIYTPNCLLDMLQKLIRGKDPFSCEGNSSEGSNAGLKGKAATSYVYWVLSFFKYSLKIIFFCNLTILGSF